MKKSNSHKVIKVLAVVAAVVGLTLGFAAYSGSLDFIDLTDNRKKGFEVKLSASENYYDDNKVVRAVASGGAVGEDAFFYRDNGTTIMNLKVMFSSPGQSVSYTFYAHNKGIYDAVLRTITFSNVLGTNKTKVCKIVNSDSTATEAVVREVCDDIKFSVQVGKNLKTNGSIDGITGHDLKVGGTETITITIEYVKDGQKPDGEFNVEFGNVMLTYLSVKDKSVSYMR